MRIGEPFRSFSRNERVWKLRFHTLVEIEIEEFFALIGVFAQGIWFPREVNVEYQVVVVTMLLNSRNDFWIYATEFEGTPNLNNQWVGISHEALRIVFECFPF